MNNSHTFKLTAASLILAASTSLQANVQWNDDFTGTLNTNYSAFSNGGGAGTTQSGGELTMDTAIPAGTATAQLSTNTDSTGSVSTFNGAKLYDFTAHDITASFGIASIAGEAPGPQKNTFFFSIGDSATSLVPASGFMDDGLGFQVWGDVGGWQLTYFRLDSTEGDIGATVAFLSNAPTEITFTLSGSVGTIDIVGATFSDNGGIGTITSTTSMTVPMTDISDNIDDYNLAFGAYNRGNVDVPTVVTLDDWTVSVVPATVPEPGIYALLAGCLALTSVMVRRRR